jgi:pimeloyl-ACP methyl ester carboxylesterase
MPKVKVNGIQLYYEEAGAGTPLIFLHEFGGDYRSWESQMRFFARRYRAITLSYRGYPPSDIPERQEDYSQDIHLEDLCGLMDALGIAKAHICGLSVGGNEAVFFGLKYPRRAISLVAAGVGHGSVRGADRKDFEQDLERRAQRLLAEGMAPVAEDQSRGGSRHPLKVKDPRGFAEFVAQYASHSALGSALTARGIVIARPNYYDIQEQLRGMTVPTLILLGDQDDLCIEGSLLLKRTLPLAGLQMFPRSGHALQLEEPDQFNRAVLDFLTAVEAGRWIRTAP